MPYRLGVDFHQPAFVASAAVGYLCAHAARTRSTSALVAGGSWSYLVLLSSRVPFGDAHPRLGAVVLVDRVAPDDTAARGALAFEDAPPQPATARASIPRKTTHPRRTVERDRSRAATTDA